MPRHRLRLRLGSIVTRTASTPSQNKGAIDKLLTRAFVRLALVDLAYFTSAGVAIYTLPLYITGPLGSNEAGAGLAFGAFAVSALLLRPFAGRLSDTRGRRPLLIGGAALCAVATLATAFVDSVALVVALRLVLGVAEAAFFVASFAALADLAPPSRMGEALSYNSLGLYLGLALGPPLGEVLLNMMGYVAAWSGGAALALIAMAGSIGMAETRSPRASVDGPARLIHWKSVPPAIGFFTSLAAIGGFLTFASLHAGAVGLARTSIPLLVYGTVVVIGRIAFAKIPDRLPSLQLGAAALATIAVGLTVSAVWRSPIGIILGTALLVSASPSARRRSSQPPSPPPDHRSGGRHRGLSAPSLTSGSAVDPSCSGSWPRVMAFRGPSERLPDWRSLGASGRWLCTTWFDEDQQRRPLPGVPSRVRTCPCWTSKATQSRC